MHTGMDGWRSKNKRKDPPVASRLQPPAAPRRVHKFAARNHTHDKLKWAGHTSSGLEKLSTDATDDARSEAAFSDSQATDTTHASIEKEPASDADKLKHGSDVMEESESSASAEKRAPADDAGADSTAEQEEDEFPTMCEDAADDGDTWADQDFPSGLCMNTIVGADGELFQCDGVTNGACFPTSRLISQLLCTAHLLSPPAGASQLCHHCKQNIF